MGIRENIEKVNERIITSARKAGRPEDEVKLMAVTKNHTREEVDEAYAAGMRLFGENRVQEALPKYENFPDDARVEMIGHLQSNKAGRALLLFDAIHSVDTARLGVELNRIAERNGREVDIYIEVNCSGEESKGGVREHDELRKLTEELLKFPTLKLKGLMTMAPFTDEESLIRSCFSECRRRLEWLREEFGGRVGKQLSMGMSNDYAIAVEEGATVLRVGSLIFGAGP